jgi:hypothetical protein
MVLSGGCCRPPSMRAVGASQLRCAQHARHRARFGVPLQQHLCCLGLRGSAGPVSCHSCCTPHCRGISCCVNSAVFCGLARTLRCFLWRCGRLVWLQQQAPRAMYTTQALITLVCGGRLLPLVAAALCERQPAPGAKLQPSVRRAGGAMVCALPPCVPWCV